ncbi:MAG: 6-pyruvoyl-tetrahydropterin synthase-related protein [Chloroflexota bacterium]|nr:6-pyruvoyl-tetrahydropterin synthase-related protein [Chloroflexota bacterium]
MSPSQAPFHGRAFHFLILIAGLVCVCLAAIQPFMLDRMPRTDDGLLQMYRGVALDHSLRVDHPLWPRYSSGLVYGYGAPLFNYFPPLSYFPAAWLHGLGFSFPGAWLLSMVIYTLLAALGIFLLGRLWTRSDLAGWMGALAYVYAPFFLFDSLTRGASAEVAALAALPFVMLGFTRLAWYGVRRDLALSLASFALFIPLHTLITLHGTALLALYCLFLVWRGDERRAVFLRLTLVGLLGLVVTAFYWLPALLEADAIKLGLISEQLGHIDVKGHLRPLSEIIAPPHTADPTQQNQAIPISLGWPQLILSAVGLLLSCRLSYRSFRPLMLLIWIIALCLVFMNTPHSAPFWEAIPLIGLTQFPWRLLGLASLLLALASGIGAFMIASALPSGKSRAFVIGSIALIMLLYALPWTYQDYHEDLEADDIGAVQRFERDGGQLALSSYAEYLPVNTDAGQLDPRRLAQRFSRAEAVPRLMPSETLEILSEQWSGTAASLRLASAEAQTLLFDWLYLPGWRADIDGRPVEVRPSAPAGLVALDAPSGEFDLRIALDGTTTQAAAQLLSLLGLFALGALLRTWHRLPGTAGLAEPAIRLDMRLLAGFAGLGLALFLVKTTALDALESPFKSYRFGRGVDAPALANFGNRIDLLAAELPLDVIDRRRFDVALYWRPHGGALDRDYASIVRLRDPGGAVIAEASSYAPGGLATSNWLTNAYIEDVISLEIPIFTPPLAEAYRLEAALFDVDSLEALSVINQAGNPLDVKYPLASLRYRPSDRQAIADDLPGIDQGAAPALLVEAPQLPLSAGVGDELRFGWSWRKASDGAAGFVARLLWQDGETKAAHVSRALPLVNGFDIAQWRLGEVFRGHHRLIVPPDLPPGSYALGAQLLDADGNPAAATILLDAAMDVSVPARQFDRPQFDPVLGAIWDNSLVLHGYRFAGAGELSLVWGTGQPLTDSLRLFVHALDEGGKIEAQWDGVPLDWTRPTTGWLPGEYLSTNHRFDLRAGQYRLRTGWYDPASGGRVGIGENDFFQLPEPLQFE